MKEKVKRDVWSDRETDYLLVLYIEEKEVMEGDFNTLIRGDRTHIGHCTTLYSVRKNSAFS
ncbi:hypothetical protein OUZ56_026607 [Daphnia magna]|uniref:Uncharacterized protein n=1 Tax=Daphnia magna TaxID=35525 RepID=A0ABQ9ZMC6_9CRUS|nr:hypothetical protein OUZ56_026607 [Daphnia magna]